MTENVYINEKNGHLQYWIIGLTQHLPTIIVSNLGIFLLI